MLRYLEPIISSITAAAYLLLFSAVLLFGYGAFRLVQQLLSIL